MPRRVVVTGVGLVSPVGVGTEASWGALCDGRTGIERITHFDASDFPCQIAGEVKGFDPLEFVTPKDRRKMGRFIFFALAASEYAMEMSGLMVTPELSPKVGVYVGSGIGGFDIIERGAREAAPVGAQAGDPVLYPRDDRKPGLRSCLHPLERKGPQLRNRDGLHLAVRTRWAIPSG